MSNRSAIPYLSVLLSTLILGSCGYATESSNQDITFLSPDALDAKCYAYVNKIKYLVYPPQTVNIKKSSEDIRLVCNAPGNRYLELEIPAKVDAKVIWGTPVGVAWDYASQSLYSYPDVIALDFSQTELVPEALPKHNNPDIKQPEEYELEEFLPSEPRLNSDKSKVKLPLMRRGESDKAWNKGAAAEVEAQAQEGMEIMVKDDVPADAVETKGDLQEAADVPKEEAVSEETSETAPSPAVTKSSELTPIDMLETASTPMPTEAVVDEVVSDVADGAPVLLVPGE